MKLIPTLVKRGLLDKEKATSLQLEAKNKAASEEEVLLEQEVISEEELYRIKSEQLRIPLKEVVPGDVLGEVLNLIPEESAQHYQMVPLSRKGNFLEVGMLRPEDMKAQEALKFLAREGKFEYDVFLITPSVFQDLLKRYQSLGGEVKRALSELEDEAAEAGTGESAAEELDRIVEDAPITKVVGVILRHAVEGRASDIHIEPTKEKTRIRFRVDGVLYSSLFLPTRVHPSVIARVKILANLKIDETRIPQDGRFSAKVAEENIDFRVSTFPTTMGEKVALRVLDPTMGKRTFEELGITGHNLAILQEATQQPYGMILSTGPTGSGKTTTLYAVLNQLNKEGVNIVTVEDPVEYHIAGINQSKVKPQIGYEFARALRYILRQDPDVIMVGEIRDDETVSLATHAALTGHILLSTLHTNNAVGAVPRLVDMGIQRFLIPSTLNIVIAQRLVRQLCPHCKGQESLPVDMKELILSELEAIPAKAQKNVKIPAKIKSFKPEGCAKCNFKGYLGRVGLYEILQMTDSLAQIVRETGSIEHIAKEAVEQGMITMRQDGILKVLNGVTSMEEILRVTTEDITT